MNQATYSVWVGGGEINDYYLTQQDAERIAEEWLAMGYTEVVIENMADSLLKTGESND